MTIKDQIKIKLIEKGTTFAEIAKILGMSKQNLHGRLKNENREVVERIEEIIGLKRGYFN